MIKHLSLSLLLIPALAYGSTPSATESRNILLRQRQHVITITQASITNNNASNNEVDTDDSKQPLTTQASDIDEDALMLMARAFLYKENCYEDCTVDRIKKYIQTSPYLALLKAVDAENPQQLDEQLKKCPYLDSDWVETRDMRLLYAYMMNGSSSMSHQSAKYWLHRIQGKNKPYEEGEENSAFGLLSGRISTWSHQSEAGFTLLMKAAALGNKELVKVLLSHGAEVSVYKNIAPWMAIKGTQIDMGTLAHTLSLNRPFPLRPKRGEDQWAFDTFASHCALGAGPLARMGNSLTPLSLACIGGHTEIVDLFLNVISQRSEKTKCVRTCIWHSFLSDADTILFALEHMLIASDIAEVDAAQVLFKSMGMKTKPQQANYPEITQKLLQAWLNRIDASNLNDQEKMKSLLVTALEHGPCELLQLIAEGLAQIPVVGKGAYYRASYKGKSALMHAKSLICADKLGMLLSINTHPRSVVYQLSHGMLEHADEHAGLLIRLKRFVRGQCATLEPVNEYLLPELSSIVTDYAFMSAKLIKRILSMKAKDAVQPSSTNNNTAGEKTAEPQSNKNNDNNNNNTQ